MPDDLPLIAPERKVEMTPRDVFAFFITGGKVNAPNGAQELQRRSERFQPAISFVELKSMVAKAASITSGPAPSRVASLERICRKRRAPGMP